MSAAPPEGAPACPLCGCPCAAIREKTVECASRACCWHDGRHAAALDDQARSDVASWHHAREAPALNGRARSNVDSWPDDRDAEAGCAPG